MQSSSVNNQETLFLASHDYYVASTNLISYASIEPDLVKEYEEERQRKGFGYFYKCSSLCGLAGFLLAAAGSKLSSKTERENNNHEES